MKRNTSKKKSQNKMVLQSKESVDVFPVNKTQAQAVLNIPFDVTKDLDRYDKVYISKETMFLELFIYLNHFLKTIEYLPIIQREIKQYYLQLDNTLNSVIFVMIYILIVVALHICFVIE